MNRFALSSLRVQAMLWTLLPLTVIMLLVGSVSFYAYNEVVGRLVQERDRDLARVSADGLSLSLDIQASVLEAMVERLRSVECFDDEGTFDERRCFGAQHGFLTSVIEECLLDDFVGPVTLLYADGVAALSVSSERVGESQNGRPQCQPAYHNTVSSRTYASEVYFQRPRDTGQTYFSDVLDNGVIDKPQIVVSVPIIDPAGRFVGVLMGSFLLEDGELGTQLAKLGVGKAYLVDRVGRVIWHTDPAMLGADLSQQAPVRELLNLRAAPNAQTLHDAQGNTIVVGYTLVTRTGWGLVIQESWDAVIGPVRVFQGIMLGALGVGLMLVMVFISSGTRRLTDPIKELVEQTQQLARGDFVGHVQGGTVTEMRSLSDAFNEMADRVARYRVGLQSYVAAITQTQEDERKRIARELHDDTIQSLIALGRRLELMEQSLENPIDAAKQLYQLQQMLTRTVAEVRQFSRDLRPLLLEDLGLVAAMRQMLREMERRDEVETELTIEGDGQVEELDDELVVAVYRIAQEALNNIRKHAQASRVEVALTFDPDCVRLVVRDDGQGFPIAETTDLARRGSFGLMGIRERAKLFGGSFEVESAPGEGTRVTVYLPLTVAPEWVLTELNQMPVPA